MRLRKRHDTRDRLRRRVAESVTQAELAQRVGGTADRLAGRLQHAASDARGTLGTIDLPRRRHSHRRRGGVIAAVLLVAAAVAIGVAWWRRRNRDEEYARLAGTPTDPFAGPAAPSSPDGSSAPIEASTHQPPTPAAPAPAPAPVHAESSAPPPAWNRVAPRTEVRSATGSFFDPSPALPRFDAIKPPTPRFDPPGPSYGKFAP